MPQDRETLLVLDCDYLAWRLRERRNRAAASIPAEEIMPDILPFTFTDVPPDPIGKRAVVLRPAGGMKS